MSRHSGSVRNRAQPPLVRRLGVASFFQDVASEMVYPLLPGFLASLGGGPALLGAMESAADATVAFVKGWAGKASDRAPRRKPFVLFGYAASALARPALALATATSQVVALRIWDRLAKGVRSAPRDALIAQSVPPAERATAFAYQRGLDHLGAALGPLLASALLAAGTPLRWVFLLATLPALLGVATIAGMSETTPRSAPPATENSRTSAGAAPTLGLSAHAAALLFGLANASDAFLLLRAAQLGAPTTALPLLWSALHVVRWAAATPGGRLADRLGARRALALGWTIYAALYAAFGFSEGLLPFALALLPYGAHAGLVEGAERAYAVELGGGAARAGASLGAWQRSAGFGALGSSLLFGVLWQTVSARAAFVAAGGAALLAVAALAALGASRLPSATQR